MLRTVQPTQRINTETYNAHSCETLKSIQHYCQALAPFNKIALRNNCI